MREVVVIDRGNHQPIRPVDGASVLDIQPLQIAVSYAAPYHSGVGYRSFFDVEARLRRAVVPVACGYGDFYVAGGVGSPTIDVHAIVQPARPIVVAFSYADFISRYQVALVGSFPRRQRGVVAPACADGFDYGDWHLGDRARLTCDSNQVLIQSELDRAIDVALAYRHGTGDLVGACD